MAKIEVLADSFKNFFREYEKASYCYSNFRAIDLAQQSMVDNCIEQMIEGNNPYVLDHNMIVAVPYEPVKTALKLELDTENLTLSLKGVKNA
ncbi:hypothetical protein [Haemophilus parahaemolyticus]|uniref:hypothetical protein n=1 Tax=Haemophilus parahaemolyticus TaxID=735 RepID=UPI0028EB0643|nr:hypothetical protein [Haemophilus parahaemolyticus]